jgi:hypothetical protein
MQARGIIAKDSLSTAGIFKHGAITRNLTGVYTQSIQNAIHNIMAHFVGQDRADAEKGLFLDLALRGAWVGWVSTNDNGSPTTES